MAELCDTNPSFVRTVDYRSLQPAAINFDHCAMRYTDLIQ